MKLLPPLEMQRKKFKQYSEMPHQKGENCHKAELLQLFTILRNYIKKKDKKDKNKKQKTHCC